MAALRISPAPARSGAAVDDAAPSPAPVAGATLLSSVPPAPVPAATTVQQAVRSAVADSASGASVAAATDEAGAKNSSVTLGASMTGSYAAMAAGNASQPAQAAPLKLEGSAQQWQQPLRDALGDRLQLQLARNDNQAVIRLEPPNLGSVEIAIRHTAGNLQVNISASNSEVLRQLNSIGDQVRQDLSQRQSNTEVAVTVTASRAQAQSQDGGGQGNRQQRDQDQQRAPSRALSEDSSSATFAMTGE
jgi:type III secretion system needle length determinant